MSPSIEGLERGGRKIKEGDILIGKNGLLYEVRQPIADKKRFANHAASVIIVPGVGESSTVDILDRSADNYAGIIEVINRIDKPQY